jgi:hypothetical protein
MKLAGGMVALGLFSFVGGCSAPIRPAVAPMAVRNETGDDVIVRIVSNKDPMDFRAPAYQIVILHTPPDTTVARVQVLDRECRDLADFTFGGVDEDEFREGGSIFIQQGEIARSTEIVTGKPEAAFTMECAASPEA